MKTVFDSSTSTQMINRINQLTDDSQAQWGKMNVHQMIKHCTLWEEMVHRNQKKRRMLIGLLLGRLLLKKALQDERPMRKNSPTIPSLIIKEKQGDLEAEKGKWIALIKEYEHYVYPEVGFVHPFFGKMTKEQIGQHSYKHIDHHLRQFNQ